MLKINTTITKSILSKQIFFNISLKSGIRNYLNGVTASTTTFFHIQKLNQLLHRNDNNPNKLSNQTYFNSNSNNFHSKYMITTNSYSTSKGDNKKFCQSIDKININNKSTDILIDIPEKIGLIAKFKLMYRKYWYVLIPVHVVTSVGWFGGFYYLSKSGVDIPALLQSLHVSELLVEKLKHSDMGHYAISYLCYKIATPVRYAVTLGGTTVAIKYLVQHGYIKPVPTKKQFIQMYEDKKAILSKRKQEK